MDEAPPVGAYGLRFTGLPLGDAVAGGAPSDWPLVRLRATKERAGAAPGGGAEIDASRAVIDLGDGLRRLVLDRAAASAVYQGPDLEVDELAHPYLGPTAAVFSRWAGREVFHGGAFVGRGGTAIAVLGARDAGKSTLLAALAARGVAVLADDLLVVDRGAVFAGPRTLDLRAAPGVELTDGGRLAVSRSRGGSRWRIGLPPAPSQLPLGGWVFLRGPSDALTCTPVPATERLQRIASARGYAELPSDPHVVLDLAALPAWDLSFPRSWAALDAAVASVLSLP